MRKLKIAYSIHAKQNSTNAIRTDLGDITIIMSEGSNLMDTFLEPYIKQTLITLFHYIKSNYQSSADYTVSCHIEDLSDEAFCQQFF